MTELEGKLMSPQFSIPLLKWIGKQKISQENMCTLFY